ncbi:MAG TPA: DUF1993 domain-containing protein [Caulobacteraceae bacterium]|jgi:hypothetical protein
MSFSMYDVSVSVFRQYLAALSGVLAKAEAHVASGALAEADVMGVRLYEDMQPFTFQIMQAVSHGAGSVHNLRGETFERPTGLETLAGCKAAVDKAVAYLDSVAPADVPNDPDAPVSLKFPGREMRFTARDYILTFVYGNFFFHCTTAYDILRMKGVPVGKRDFLGAAKMTVVA